NFAFLCRVANEIVDREALGAQLSERMLGALAVLQGSDHHFHAFARKVAGDCFADAGGSASDDGDLTRKLRIPCHVLLLMLLRCAVMRRGLGELKSLAMLLLVRYLVVW